MYVEKADAFISHAHSYLFEDFLSALRWRLRDEPDASVWIDLFSINQHEPVHWTFEWLSTTFKTNVATIQRTIMVMSPWDCPLPYTRSWCVFEVYCTADSGGKFEIAMNKSDETKFLDDIREHGQDRIDGMLATIRAEKSKCSVESDRESIFAVIRATVGFSKLDSMVFECYREWVITVSLQALAACNDDPCERMELLSTVGMLYSSNGSYEKAEKYHRQCLDQANEIGHDHPSLLIVSMINLASTLQNLGKYAEAEGLCLSCLKQQKAVVLGNGHPDTFTNFLATINNLAAIYEIQGKYSAAEGLYRMCLERQNMILGGFHPDTLTTFNNLAGTFDNQGKYAKAELLYRLCMDRQKVTLGDDHPHTLNTTNNLGRTFIRQGRYAEAEDLHRTCLERRKAIFGDDHPHTLISMNNLAATYYNQGKYADAEDLHRSCMERRNAVLGEDHPRTLLTIDYLARTCEIQGKYAEAENLYRLCLQRRKDTLGDDHRETLRTINNLARVATLNS
jgi:tetratricopeptide (TPR) repeat protein